MNELDETETTSDLPIVRRLINEGKANTLTNESGHTLLHARSFDGKTRLVQLLTDHGVDVNAKSEMVTYLYTLLLLRIEQDVLSI